MCNCDKVTSSDVGTFIDSQAGIQYVYVKMLKSRGSANISIGPIECYGDAGHDSEKTWTFKVGKFTFNPIKNNNLEQRSISSVRSETLDPLF